MVYFLSDAHLGSRVIPDGEEHIGRLVNLLSRMEQDATSVYLLGDMFDFWFEYYWCDPSKKQYVPFLQTLRRMTDKGIEVHYFIGNHDLWTFGYLEQQTGVQVHREPLSCVLYGKSVFLCHGDGLVPTNAFALYPPAVRKKIRRFMLLRRVFHSPFPQVLFRALPPRWGNAFGYGWAAKSRSRELAHPCPYKGEQQEELVLFAKEREQQHDHHDFYIFGHRHIELDLQITPHSRVVVLGDCFRRWTYACLDEKGLTLCNDA